MAGPPNLLRRGLYIHNDTCRSHGCRLSICCFPTADAAACVLCVRRICGERGMGALPALKTDEQQFWITPQTKSRWANPKWIPPESCSTQRVVRLYVLLLIFAMEFQLLCAPISVYLAPLLRFICSGSLILPNQAFLFALRRTHRAVAMPYDHPAACLFCMRALHQIAQHSA